MAKTTTTELGAPLPRLMTLPETAAYLQIGKRTLYRWRAERKGPRSVSWGAGNNARIRYRSSDVAAWLEANAEDLPAPARRVGRPRKAAAS